MTHLPEVSITRPDPHCRVWARARASLWGHANDHDLDEAVILSDEAPVRVRHTSNGLAADRPLALKTTRAGTHIAMRFYLKGAQYFEIDIGGVNAINATETANVDLRS